MKANEFQADNRNANKGTKHGKKMVADSLKEYGAGRSILLDKDDRIVAGNKTAFAAGDMPVRIIETDGTELIAVKRTDLSLDDKRARELAIADNRAAQVGLEWDTSVLKTLQNEIDLEKFFKASELKRMFHEEESMEQNPDLAYAVIIDCDSEQHQSELLAKLEAEGHKCRLLIS